MCRIVIDAINMQLDEIKLVGRSSLRAEKRNAGAVPALAPLFPVPGQNPVRMFPWRKAGVDDHPGQI